MERESIISAAWERYVAGLKGPHRRSAVLGTWGRLRFHEKARETLESFEVLHHRAPTADELLYAMNHR